MNNLRSARALIEHQERQRDYAIAWQSTIDDIPDLFTELELIPVEIRFDANDGAINIRFTGDGDLLGRVWNVLRTHGYQPTSRPEPNSSQFYCTWVRKAYANIWMNYSSSVCQRMKVGTQTVTQDVYEIRCGELPMLDHPSVSV